jgi:predicted nucleic-acid-binding protein
VRLVDTNVIVRYVLGDARDPKTALAIDFIERQCSAERPGLVTSVVLVELVWVLGSRYRLKKREIVAAIDALVQNANLQLDSEDELLAALDAYREYAVDFADCLIAARQCPGHIRGHFRPKGGPSIPIPTIANRLLIHARNDFPRSLCPDVWTDRR